MKAGVFIDSWTSCFSGSTMGRCPEPRDPLGPKNLATLSLFLRQFLWVLCKGKPGVFLWLLRRVSICANHPLTFREMVFILGY